MVRQFYLSEEYVQAEEMAKFKAVIEGGSPMVNEFFFDEEFLDSDELRVCCFEDYSEEWARFVFANRDAANEFIHNYDIVYGLIATSSDLNDGSGGF